VTGILGHLGRPHMLGPIVAMTVVGLTVLAYELRRRRPGRWRWRWLSAWLVPAATSAAILTALLHDGLSRADELASVLALFVAVMGNFGQWTVILRAAGRPEPAGPAGRPEPAGPAGPPEPAGPAGRPEPRDSPDAAPRPRSEGPAEPVLDTGDVHGRP
jgi:hypothetical protein